MNSLFGEIVRKLGGVLFWIVDTIQGLLAGLRTINDILLVFEFKLEEEKYSDRFVIHDKKN